MANLTRAHQELFRRRPDERFESLPALLAQCRKRQGAVHRPLAAPRHAHPGPARKRPRARPRPRRGVRAQRLELHPALRARAGLQGHGQPALGGDGEPGLPGDDARREQAAPALHDGAGGAVDPRAQLHAALQRRPRGDAQGVRGRFPAAAEGFDRRDGPLLRGAGPVRVPHRPDRLGGDRRRGVRPRLLRLEQRGREALGRDPDLLVPGGLPEPHRLGRDRGRRVHPEAHGQGRRGPRGHPPHRRGAGREARRAA